MDKVNRSFLVSFVVFLVVSLATELFRPSYFLLVLLSVVAEVHRVRPGVRMMNPCNP